MTPGELARRLAADVFGPAAADVDAGEVPASHVAALRDAGLFGVIAPVECGGLGAAWADQREVAEALAGACGATWFVWTQHNTPLRTVIGSDRTDVRERWLRPLATAATVAGIALSHLRRPVVPVTAARVAGGWVVDGRVDWVTSWGLADTLLLAAVAGDDVVLSLVPARAGGGIAPTPLRLAAMNGARNVALELTALSIPDEDVVEVLPLERWRATDRLVAANATPAVFGLLAAIVARLRDVGVRRRSAGAADAAAGIADRTADLRRRAYALAEEEPADRAEDLLAERVAVRAESLVLLQHAAVALVAVTSGAGMLAGDPTQRMAREAMFHLVQAQTADVREATLARLAR